MIFAISPKHTTEDFKNGWTIDDKIEVFIARVDGWQLGVARELIDKDVSHRGFALLHIVVSYFEMLAKYREGFTGEGRSRHYFKKGLLAVFPNIDPSLQESDDLLNTFYDDVRSGLYHLGMTKVNVTLTDNIPGSIGYNAARKLIVISPDKLVGELQLQFNAYAAELRNPVNVVIRSNFEKRFDMDNS